MSMGRLQEHVYYFSKTMLLPDAGVSLKRNAREDKEKSSK